MSICLSMFLSLILFIGQMKIEKMPLQIYCQNDSLAKSHREQYKVISNVPWFKVIIHKFA